MQQEDRIKKLEDTVTRQNVQIAQAYVDLDKRLNAAWAYRLCIGLMFINEALQVFNDWYTS